MRVGDAGGYNSIGARTLIRSLCGLIRAYQLLLAPVLPPSCRYYPSCSHYAAEAIERHGALHGLHLAARRLSRCHPWGGSGYDPVPDRRATT
jgi:putative membrane protein insertion efficiency factor